jgi:hypothetical protein
MTRGAAEPSPRDLVIEPWHGMIGQRLSREHEAGGSPKRIGVTAMDMQVRGSAKGGVPAQTSELTYSWLYEQVQFRADLSIYPKPSQVEKLSFRSGLAAACVGLLVAAASPSVIPPILAAVVASICLLIEVVGFLVGGVLTAKREWRQYAKPRLSHAEEMDGEFNHWRTLIESLREFPRKQIEERLRFVTALRQGMTERMGLMYGGLQKLGPFPVLAALYLQFRNWEWGDWAGAFDVNLVAGLLIFSMVLMYVVGWLMVAVRTRLDTCVSLLEAALQPD